MLDFDTLNRPFRKFQSEITKVMDQLEPLMGEVYKHLKDENYIYDWENLTMDGVRGKLLDINSTYYGIVKGCDRGDMIYIDAENSKFLILLNEKEYTDSYDETVGIGMRVYRVYSEIDIDCIEKSWHCNTTERWITKLDLTRETFTDVTEHSQVIPKGNSREEDLIVCKRPTIKRVIEDLNKKLVPFYPCVYDKCGRSIDRTDDEFGLVNYAYRMMVVACVDLEIGDCSI